MDSFVKLICFCLVLLQNCEWTQSLEYDGKYEHHNEITTASLVVSTSYKECSECFHITVKYLNMSNYFQSLVTDSLKVLEDIPCKKNTAKRHVCDRANYGYSMKCAYVNQTIAFHGMNTISPGAGMEMHMIYRGCLTRPSGEADTCEDVSAVGQNAAQTYLQSIQGITKMFSSVKYSGQICYSSDHNNQNRGNNRIISSALYLVPISLALNILRPE